MEEKRSKVNIVLAVLFVLAIITICVMAIYINKLSSEKEKISAKADSLNANVQLVICKKRLIMFQML